MALLLNLVSWIWLFNEHDDLEMKQSSRPGYSAVTPAHQADGVQADLSYQSVARED